MRAVIAVAALLGVAELALLTNELISHSHGIAVAALIVFAGIYALLWGALIGSHHD